MNTKEVPPTITKNDYVTVLKTNGRGNKLVQRNNDGTAEKLIPPPITEAVARTVCVKNPKAMRRLLRKVGKKPNLVLSLGYVPGTEPVGDEDAGEPFKFVSKKIMGEALGVDPDTPEGLEAVLGWQEIDGERCICRLKINMAPSSWCLFDIDAVRGMPERLANMSSDDRIDALADIIPGFADAGVVILPSTTGRVLIDGIPMDATGEHFYVQLKDAADLERFGAVLLQRSFLLGYGFMRPRYSKSEPDKIVSHVPWAIADPTTFSHERLVYDGSPTVRGKGLELVNAIIETLDGGRLDSSLLPDLTDDEAATYAEMTGQRVVKGRRTESIMSADGKVITHQTYRFGAVDDRQLKMDTVIETQIGTMTIKEYYESDHGKLRCQTPFRESFSWNGILNRHRDGTPFVYDNGIRCRYVLSAALIEKHRPEICAIRLVALYELIETTAAMCKPIDKRPLLKAFAQMDFDSETDKSLAEKDAAKALGLGNKVNSFREDIAAEKKLLRGKNSKNGLDADDVATIEEGQWPIDKPLPPEIFPAKKGEAILSHADNYKTMMAGYGYECSYDVIKKEVFWVGPQINMTTDNAYLALFSKMKGLSAMNGLPHGNTDLDAHLPAIAEENQINPVRDYLAALVWDGKDRIRDLVKAIEPHDTEIAEITLRVWFTGAAAACEHFETGLMLVHGSRPSFEYVLALLGEQGVNKTKGFLGLVPKALAKYAKDGLSIKTSNKDSVKIAVSYWLVELGELDATFRQGQIAELKAFLSTEADELRLVYAKGYSKFKRRTAFIGTVNQDKFLKDATGNRRYLVIECTNGFPLWSAAEVDQLWAQVWARYVGGAQWWPTADEQILLDINAERFLQYSWAETRIREVFDFSRPTKHNKRITATDLWAELCSPDGYSKPIRSLAPQQSSELRAAMKKLWGEHGAEKRKGEQVIKTKRGVVNTYSDSGANKGWLVPMTVDEVVKSDREEATQLARLERVKAIITEILDDDVPKGKEPSVNSLLKRVIAALKEEFEEKTKNSAFSGIFQPREWEIVFEEVIADFRPFGDPS